MSLSPRDHLKMFTLFSFLILVLIESVLSSVQHSITFHKPKHSLSRFSFVSDIVQEITESSAFLSDQRAINNVIIGVYGPECSTVYDELYTFKGAHRTIGENNIILGTLNTLKHPEIANLFPDRPHKCAWLVHLDKNDPITRSSFYSGEMDRIAVRAWIAKQTSASLSIRNHLSFPVTILWMKEGRGEQRISSIASGGSGSQQSHLGHYFALRNEDTGAFVDYFMVDRSKMQITLRPEDLNSFKDESQFYRETEQHFISTRYASNYFQPPLVQNVTAIGFKKMRCPEDLFSEISKWYKQAEPNEKKESTTGPVINQDISPTYMSFLNGPIRSRIIDEIRPILEDWSGHELKMTSLYGIRKYTQGGVLRMHVDTVVTHVVSVIVNVDQDVQEDWMLEIVDHDGNLHEIAMEPGDMVLYESAKALHGRPKPLQGKSYSNFFLHYQPKTPGFWDYAWV